MEEIKTEEVRKMISGLKYCPKWNDCNRRSCEKGVLLLLDENKMSYPKKVMEEHNLTTSELENLLAKYKKTSSSNKKDDGGLNQKIGKIYEMFKLRKTYLEDINPDNCPLN